MKPPEAEKEKENVQSVGAVTGQFGGSTPTPWVPFTRREGHHVWERDRHRVRRRRAARAAEADDQAICSQVGVAVGRAQ